MFLASITTLASCQSDAQINCVDTGISNNSVEMPSVDNAPDTDIDNDSGVDTGVDTAAPVTELNIEFTTVWSSAVPFPVEPGQTDINLGSWIFQSGTGDPITVQEMYVIGYTDVEGDYIFHYNDGDLGVHLGNCRLVDATYRNVVMGPVEINDYGAFSLTDDFIVEGENGTALTLLCDLNKDVQDLKYLGFGFDIQSLDVESTASSHRWHGRNTYKYVDDGSLLELSAYVNMNN